MQGLCRVLLLMACGAPWTLGQHTEVPSYPKIEYFAGYSAIETNNHTFYYQNIGPVGELDYDENGWGVEAGVIANLRRYFSVAGDFSSYFSSNPFSGPTATNCSQPPCPTATQTGNIKPRLLNFLAGPEFKWRNHTRVTPFVNALFGIAHSSGTLSETGSVYYFTRSDAETGFGMAFRGGFDLRVTRRASFRGSLSYNEAFVGSNVLPSQRVDAVGWSAGVLFH